jgi:hypothetical protein
MGKLRSNSTWNSFTNEQLETLEEWLFVDRLGYQEAKERVAKEFGVTCSTSGLCRYYRKARSLRVEKELTEMQGAANRLNGSEAKVESLRLSALKMIGKRLLEIAMDDGEVAELAALGRLLTESEEREIQRGRLELARERFEFRAAEAALAEMPRLEGMKAEDLEREQARILAIKQRLFGGAKPNGQPQEAERCT